MTIRSIRPLAPQQCPQCAGKQTFVITREKIECQRCGYIVRDEKHQPVPPNPRPQRAPHDRTQYKISYRITHRGGVESYVEAAFTTAMDHAKRQDWDGAIKHLRRCIDFQSDFSDAHLWLSRLLEDPVERRDHITSVLAHEPTHGEALRELMIIDGEISGGGEFNEFTMPETRDAGGAVATVIKNARCPRCGSSTLSDDDAGGVLLCDTCGYREDKGKHVGAMSLLSAALIKQRSQPVRWQVGERYLKCGSCGSSRTIAARQMVETCPFCGSKNVIEQDALETLRQPDGIVPFALSRKNALENLENELSGFGEKLKGLFNNHKVKRVEIEGLFLPFWTFDVILDLLNTIIDTSMFESSRRERNFNVYQTETIPEAANNVLIPGFKYPPRALIDRLGKYSLSRVVGYDPRALAQHSAEIYTLPFDQAAMEAHEQVANQVRQKYHANVSCMVKHMTFRLLLLPVWTITIFEQDHQVRPGLINGQTGRVALGRPQRLGR
ncbi:MAG: hypothetical protein MUF87_20040 [Anaerolineae bacterium]|nr:hypothetical protein [Anaerolineae bacterium]